MYIVHQASRTKRQTGLCLFWRTEVQSNRCISMVEMAHRLGDTRLLRVECTSNEDSGSNCRHLWVVEFL